MQTPKNKKRTGDICSWIRKQLVVSDMVGNRFLDNSENLKNLTCDSFLVVISSFCHCFIWILIYLLVEFVCSNTGRKVEDPELLEAIRLTIINNLIEYHPVFHL
jgi:hypothetical protein